MRRLPLKLRYRPRRVECPRCGVRVEDFLLADPWERVTRAIRVASKQELIDRPISTSLS
ncbi:MAG: hypothetical protein M3Y07_03815 [Acidobacteriota bacterium]|nr:hypothetical protein [Acidobacteriota bacterium]